MSAVHRLLDLIYPRKCVLCREILHKEETDLCKRCRLETPRYYCFGRKLPRIADFTAVWYYEDQVRESLIRYKFGNVRSYASAYGRFAAMRIMEDLGPADIITWVPVSARRKWQRGYDQVELIAKVVGLELGIPCEPLLKKVRHNRPQSSLEKAEQRRANVLGVYQPLQIERIRGRRILLIDDILTTGATASECARVLLTAGAKEIIFAAVAAGRNQNE